MAARSESLADTGTWVVVAAHNEEERLGDTLRGLGPAGVTVVVVDDGSIDGTAQVAARFPVWLLRHSANHGQGAALQTGIDFALSRGARVIVTFDADGQHDPADLPKLITPIGEGAVDVTLGSRFLGTTDGLPFSRWITLKLAIMFTRLFSGIHVTDTHNGLRGFSREAARRIRISHHRMAHASEILDRVSSLGLRFREVGVAVRYTPQTLSKGQSSWNAVRIAAQFLLGRVFK